jgi:hypothetical protein
LTDVQRSRVTTGVGVLLIALGLLFLAQQVFGFSWSSAWPFFIVAVGLVFFAGVVVGGRLDRWRFLALSSLPWDSSCSIRARSINTRPGPTPGRYSSSPAAWAC